MSKRRGGDAPDHSDVQYFDGEHRLVLVNRNDADGVDSHRHPWQATCVCGWRAVATRRRAESEQRYRVHKNSRRKLAKRLAAGDTVEPRRVTPLALLPEVLR